MSPSRNELAAPEHLDRALYVTTPKAWIALCVLMLLTGAALAWALLGEIASYVQGNGIILSRGGTVFDASSPAAGTLARIVPSLGSTVAAGDVVAEIRDAETRERHATALALAEEGTRTLRARRTETTEENALAEDNLAKQRANLDLLEQSGVELVEAARKRHAGNLVLLDRGLIARQLMDSSEEDIDLARRNLFDVRRRRDELEAAELRRRNELRIRVTDAETSLLEAERQAREVEALMETWRIRAPVSGRVTEVKAQVGAVLDPGQSVLGIETGDEGLDVLIYVISADGKRIEPGMPALVSPNTVRAAEYGYLVGTVQSLSEFPASVDSMAAVLQNRELAETFSAAGTPYSGRITLAPDPATASGFAWTSPKGADIDVRAGTLAEIEIEVDRQPPISLVIPLIKEGLGY